MKARNPDSIKTDLAKGCACFNAQEYWEAHEAWESAWKNLESGPERRRIQAWIQAAASAYLLKKKRISPAVRLAVSAQGKLATILARSQLGWAIPGIKIWLKRVAQAGPEMSERESSRLIRAAKNLRAQPRLSKGMRTGSESFHS